MSANRGCCHTPKRNNGIKAGVGVVAPQGASMEMVKPSYDPSGVLAEAIQMGRLAIFLACCIFLVAYMF